MPDITLHAGDNRDTLRRLIAEGVRVHAVVTDPPYGLTSVTKRFGKEGSAPARTEGNDGSFARLSGGFMGKMWDGSGIERDPEFWRLVYDILLPGGCVFAFGGSRTGHWLACAMETAGFIMHPMHGWVYGTGFPKAHNAARAVDKALGAEGTLDGVKPGHADFANRKTLGHVGFKGGAFDGEGGFQRPWMEQDDAAIRFSARYVPGSPEAAQWDGWSYGTQTQKPALEPIFLGQKPYSEKTGAKNLLTHGVGAFNIDGCRVPLASDDTDQFREINRNLRQNETGAEGDWGMNSGAAQSGVQVLQEEGRWPANLLLDDSPEVEALFPDSKGQLAPVGPEHAPKQGTVAYGDYGPRPAAEPRSDSGTAARFFHRFGPDADPVIYSGKATKVDRAGSRHPTVKPIALLRYLIRHITPEGGVVLDPFAGSGTTAEAARQEGFDCILMEAEPEYCDFLRERFDLPGDSLADLDALLFGDNPEDLI